MKDVVRGVRGVNGRGDRLLSVAAPVHACCVLRVACGLSTPTRNTEHATRRLFLTRFAPRAMPR